MSECCLLLEKSHSTDRGHGMGQGTAGVFECETEVSLDIFPD